MGQWEGVRDCSGFFHAASQRVRGPCKSSRTQDKSSGECTSLAGALPAQCLVSQRGGSPGTPQPRAGSSAGCTSAAATKTSSDMVKRVPGTRCSGMVEVAECCQGAAPSSTAKKALVLPLEHTHSSPRNCHSMEFKAKRAVTPEQSQCSRFLGCGMVHRPSFSASSNRAQTVGQQLLLPYTD